MRDTDPRLIVPFPQAPPSRATDPLLARRWRATAYNERQRAQLLAAAVKLTAAVSAVAACLAEPKPPARP